MPQDLSGLQRIKNTKEALARAIVAACKEYANGGFRGRPIVAQHFTQGNQARQGWAALSPGYALWKSGATPALKKSMKQAKRSVPAGKGMPMLVLTGALRDAVTGGRAVVRRLSYDRFVITWDGLPDYATHLHTGTPRMPRRSPVDLSQSDKDQIIMAANRYLSLAVAAGGQVPLGLFGNQARVL
jgi:hypothetical protein